MALAKKGLGFPKLSPLLAKRQEGDLSEECTGSRVQLRPQQSGGEDLGVSGWQPWGCLRAEGGVRCQRPTFPGGREHEAGASAEQHLRGQAPSPLSAGKPQDAHPATGPRRGNEACVSRLDIRVFFN